MQSSSKIDVYEALRLAVVVIRWVMLSLERDVDVTIGLSGMSFHDQREAKVA